MSNPMGLQIFLSAARGGEHDLAVRSSEAAS
jgi:hypothetical protein